jgi:hypothetical protein
MNSEISASDLFGVYAVLSGMALAVVVLFIRDAIIKARAKKGGKVLNSPEVGKDPSTTCGDCAHWGVDCPTEPEHDARTCVVYEADA